MILTSFFSFPRDEIQRLESEQKETMTELRLIESRSNQGRDDKVTEDLGELGRKKCKLSPLLLEIDSSKITAKKSGLEESTEILGGEVICLLNSLEVIKFCKCASQESAFPSYA